MPTSDLTSYIDGLRARQLASRAADAEWQRNARALADRLGALLSAEFGARRVLVFGSVARREATVGSDVDLLVEGIAADRWFEACAAVAGVAGRVEVDLVPWDACRPWVRERALREGEVVHG